MHPQVTAALQGPQDTVSHTYMQWVSGDEWYRRSPECDVSTLCTTPAKGMHPGHTVNIIHSFMPACLLLLLLLPSASAQWPCIQSSL
jgi:hypothetical protein